MSASTEIEPKTDPPTFGEILDKASKSAFRGGLAGAVAMGANVGCLMWMRTTVSQRLHACFILPGRLLFMPFIMLFCNYHDNHQVNYQYRNGTSFPVALRTLYADGGIPRFYRGVLPALIQGPMSRFGDTAANTGMITLFDSMEQTKGLNVGVKTASASAAAALFRIFLMPVVRGYQMCSSSSL